MIALGLILLGTLLTVTFGPTFLCLKYPHKYGPWELVSIKYERRTCRRCLTSDYRKGEFWERITTPPPPSTSHIAMTADERFPLQRHGTDQIPRLTNGALSLTPAPPVIAGGRHVVLDHE